MMIGEGHGRVDRLLIAPRVYGVVDVRRHLPPYHRADEPHQPLRFPEIPAADRLDDDKKRIVNLILNLLCSQLPAQIKPDARCGTFHASIRQTKGLFGLRLLVVSFYKFR